MKNYHTLKSIKATFSINNYMKKNIDDAALEFVTLLDWSNIATLSLELLELDFKV
ncbi:hypothetical protein [Psychrobacter sp. P11F6]|uniref:hypothetical protein n=1 Tax=Psychrobacter sp. P11F6 TaxID=1699621 RepID=UPI000A7C4080|nr:hypothetical protein [Psychrobacter sp. P11F6]